MLKVLFSLLCLSFCIAVSIAICPGKAANGIANGEAGQDGAPGGPGCNGGNYCFQLFFHIYTVYGTRDPADLVGCITLVRLGLLK